MRKFTGTILLFILLVACSNAPEISLPAETLQPTLAARVTETLQPIITARVTETLHPTIIAQVTETPVTLTSPNACPPETVDLKLFTNTADGYCFLYPMQDTPLPPAMVVINPNGSSGGDFLPGDALVLVNTEAALGRTAAQAADAKIAEAGEGFDITRSEILIAGKQAIVVDGLPAQDSWRVVFIVGNERLYTLFFEPWEPNAAWYSELEKLYSSVIASFHLYTPIP